MTDLLSSSLDLADPKSSSPGIIFPSLFDAETLDPENTDMQPA